MSIKYARQLGVVAVTLAIGSTAYAADSEYAPVTESKSHALQDRQANGSRNTASGKGQARTSDIPLASEKGSELTQRPVIPENLMGRRADQVIGLDVKNSKGEDVGEVERVAIDRTTNKLYALVSVGGLFGIGDKLIPMEMSRFQLKSENLIFPTEMTEDDLKQMQAYNDARFMNLEFDQILGQATRRGSESAISPDRFSELDKNGDGKITKDEAINSDDLLRQRWESADSNRDQGIDRSEFSAFETNDSSKPEK